MNKYYDINKLKELQDKAFTFIYNGKEYHSQKEFIMTLKQSRKRNQKIIEEMKIKTKGETYTRKEIRNIENYAKAQVIVEIKKFLLNHMKIRGFEEKTLTSYSTLLSIINIFRNLYKGEDTTNEKL